MDKEIFLKECVIEWGIKYSEIKKIYDIALEESKSFCKENDLLFIKEVMKELLQPNDNFTKNFIKSEHKDFDKFYNSLFDEDTVSTDFAPNLRPQGNLHTVYTDEEPIEDENENELDYKTEA